MNIPNVHAGRLERRVRRVGNETMPGLHGCCSIYSFGAILTRQAAIAPYRVGALSWASSFPIPQ